MAHWHRSVISAYIHSISLKASAKRTTLTCRPFYHERPDVSCFWATDQTINTSETMKTQGICVSLEHWTSHTTILVENLRFSIYPEMPTSCASKWQPCDNVGTAWCLSLPSIVQRADLPGNEKSWGQDDYQVIPFWVTSQYHSKWQKSTSKGGHYPFQTLH